MRLFFIFRYRWHFACTDLERMLQQSASLTLAQDPEDNEGTVQSIIIEGFGFYSEASSISRGFFVDEISFSSELRTFESQYVRCIFLFCYYFTFYIHGIYSTYHLPGLTEYQFTALAWRLSRETAVLLSHLHTF